MSGKIIPAAVAAVLLASTGLASAQAPSAEGAGQGPYQGPYQSPAVQSITPAPYAQFNGYYNMAPTSRYNGPAQRRRVAPENGAGL
jgi:hypothetical protein